NLIRELPALEGRVFSVAVSRDGKRIAAGSSLDGRGEIGIYGYEFDTALPEAIKQIQAKVVTSRSAEENKKLEEFHVQDVKQIAKVPVAETGIYSVAFQPDSKMVAATGADGQIRLIDAETGKVQKTFGAAPQISAAIASADKSQSGRLANL